MPAFLATDFTVANWIDGIVAVIHGMLISAQRSSRFSIAVTISSQPRVDQLKRGPTKLQFQVLELFFLERNQVSLEALIQRLHQPFGVAPRLRVSYRPAGGAIRVFNPLRIAVSAARAARSPSMKAHISRINASGATVPIGISAAIS